MQDTKTSTLTFSTVMRGASWCRHCLEGDLAAAEAIGIRDRYEQALKRWKESGFHDLGEWPEPGVNHIQHMVETIERSAPQ